MEHLKIISEKENNLFKRKEIVATLDKESSPSKEESTKLLSEKFSSKPEDIKIKKIHGKFGSKNFIIEANIYPSENDKKAIEQKPKEKKK
jgi:ribosomal protein S24E